MQVNHMIDCRQLVTWDLPSQNPRKNNFAYLWLQLFAEWIGCSIHCFMWNEYSFTHSPDFKSMVSCQKGPTRHANAWQIGPFWQDTIEMWFNLTSVEVSVCMVITSCSKNYGMHFSYDNLIPQTKLGVSYQKQVSKTRTSHCIPQYL